MTHSHTRDLVVCAGILVADHVNEPIPTMPAPGQLMAADRMYLHTGGCAANVAVSVAKQGLPTAVTGKVGDDIWGRFVTGDLAARGVETGAVRLSGTEQTSQTMILLCRGEDRRFIHTFGANREFRAGDVDEDLLRRAALFYVGGYLAMPALLPDELGALLRRCRSEGIITVLDVVMSSDCSYSGELEPVLPHTDYFLPNNDEGLLLTGERDALAQAKHLRALGAGTVVITRGEAGLLWLSEEGGGQARPYPVDALDGTGAGDAFCAGFISGLIRGFDLPRSLAYGSALGHSCVRAIGASDGVFTAPEAEAFLAEHPLDIQVL